MADIATVSLRRLGRDDASTALSLWPQYKDLPYAEEDRLAITRDIGVRLAKKVDPAALPFMAANDPQMKSDDVSEWRVRWPCGPASGIPPASLQPNCRRHWPGRAAGATGACAAPNWPTTV
ncbi:hypothetical protein UMZ34_25730 [Halopseudomonas pachastrellae]|nr:hypothetical protein UMZ34_25730 [Halopseudomonas pachastrellae]